MVFGYSYCWWQNRQWRTNAPRPPAVSMATAVRRSNTDGIAWCGMSRATLEATGCRHRATTPSVLPQLPPGQQAHKQQSTNTTKKLAVLMAMAMRRYVTAHIARWRRFRALLDATKRRHRVSIAANSCNWSRMCQFFTSFSSSTCTKRSQVDAKAPVFNRGITYQTKEKGLIKVSI
jgi:hypothetical protein